jgi:hypothetical protein
MTSTSPGAAVDDLGKRDYAALLSSRPTGSFRASVTRGIGYYYRVTATDSSPATSSPSNMRFSGSNSGRVIRLGGWRGVVQ